MDPWMSSEFTQPLELNMSVTMREMLEAGVHFGHPVIGPAGHHLVGVLRVAVAHEVPGRVHKGPGRGGKMGLALRVVRRAEYSDPT